MDPATDSDVEEEHNPIGEEHEQPAAPPPPPPRRLRIDDFLQLIAGVQERRAARTNDDLVQHLKREGTFTSDSVRQALLACPRRLFIPAAHREEAYIDAPIRVEEHGFNISAPHIHATALEALDIQPGEVVLDVGCGCGIMAAAMAHMAGRSGKVVAVDIRPAALSMSQRALAMLRSTDGNYAASACSVDFHLHNIFLPSSRHTGKYDKVYVGAACPKNRVKDLLKLVNPERGGLLLAPVDSELLLMRKDPAAQGGSAKARMLSAVRFTELEVPRDIDVVLAVMKEQADAERAITLPPSTFDKDMASIMRAPATAQPTSLAPQSPTATAAAAAASEPVTPTSAASAMSVDLGLGLSAAVDDHVMARTPSDAGDALSHRQSLDYGLRDSSFKRHKPDDAAIAPAAGAAGLLPEYLAAASPALLAALGAPDCILHGSCSITPAGAAGAEGPSQELAPAWQLPAHRAVLQARCEHFRARFGSGMRDANEKQLAAPDGVSAAAVSALLRYCYTDAGVDMLPLEQVCEVLHIAAFYGCPHLAKLCELQLALVLTSPEEGAPEAACQVLALAQEAVLPQLKTLALSYIVEQYEVVSKTESYRQLARPLVDDIAAAACAHTARVMASLKSIAGGGDADKKPAEGGGGGGDDDDDDDW